MLYKAPKEPVDFLGKTEVFQGKPREQWHPFDRKSGTGKTKVEMTKGGHGKNNWGNLEDELKLGEITTVSSATATDLNSDMKKKITVE